MCQVFHASLSRKLSDLLSTLSRLPRQLEGLAFARVRGFESPLPLRPSRTLSLRRLRVSYGWQATDRRRLSAEARRAKADFTTRFSSGIAGRIPALVPTLPFFDFPLSHAQTAIDSRIRHNSLDNLGTHTERLDAGKNPSDVSIRGGRTWVGGRARGHGARSAQ